MPIRKHPYPWILATIFGLAIVVRIVLFLNFPIFVTNDSPDYLRAAGDLYYRLDFASFGLRDVRAPGYSLFLAAAYPLTAMHSDRIIILQSLVGLLNILLAILLGRLLNSWPVTFALALVMAFHPLFLLLEHAIMTETLFMACLLSFGALTVLCLQGRVNWLTGLLMGLALATCSLIRPNALLFCAVLAAGAIYAWLLRMSQAAGDSPSRVRTATLGVIRSALGSGRFWQFTVAAGLAAALLIVPWMWRNYNLYGVFTIRNWNYRNLLLTKAVNGQIDEDLPLLQAVNRQLDHRGLDYDWFWKLGAQYPALEAENITRALFYEQVAAHPGWQIRDMLESLFCYSGICIIDASADRLAPKYWLYTVVNDPALNDRLNRDAALAASNPDYVYVPSRYSSPLALKSWRWAGVIALAGLRPLLFLAFLLIVGYYAVNHLRGGRRVLPNTATGWVQTAAIYVFSAGCLAMVAAHSATLSDNDRYALPFDLFALAAVILALQHLWPARFSKSRNAPDTQPPTNLPADSLGNIDR